MGIFNLFKKDPTETWSENRLIEKVLNFRNGSFGGINFGDKPELLIKFGKPENAKPFKKKSFIYGKEGFIVSFDETTINYFSFALVDNEYENIIGSEFQLVDMKGNYHTLSNLTTVDDLEKILGKATEIYESEEGEDRVYNYGKYQIDIELSPDGKLVCFDVSI